ncbi:hypothetical protein XENOCAPTIV_024717 [Xenoophorus captivus]|uniref:SH3 domain-containing protein n=1 Tax=Xenoophorus captivus TaxID=1517983 RepID=A0ABV0Q6W6_9TELE
MNRRDSWQRGCNAWGLRGLFPVSCVKELNLSSRSRQLSERSAQAQASELPPYALGQARALMSLHAQLNEELDFREGDLIIITGRPEPGWFQGELEGQRGIFPEGFVELLGPLRSPQVPDDGQYLDEDASELMCKKAYIAGEGTEEEVMEEGERNEEQSFLHEYNSATAQTNTREQNEVSIRLQTQPHRPMPPPHKPPERPRSTPPARPRLPPRPSLPPHRSGQQVSPKSNGNQSSYTNSNRQPLQPKRTQSLHNKPPSLGKALITVIEGPKQQRLTRHASVSDADMKQSAAAPSHYQNKTQGPNGILPASITLEALATSASDLEAKLSQQLFEFEKSLTTSYSETNVSSAAFRNTSPSDLNQQSQVSRHFSILGFSNENDIIRGSSHSPVSNLLHSNTSSLERHRTLRPPPPRPRVHCPPAPTAYRPTRPAPRPPPRSPRQNGSYPACRARTNSPIFHSLDKTVTNVQAELGDPMATHENETLQDTEQDLNREMEAETEKQKEERYQVLLRLQEVEHEMEEYAQTAEELRAMLEEEEEETARLQTLENLEFCNYTLETLALEQQQLQGKTVRCCNSHRQIRTHLD